MKKQLLLGTALFAAISAFPQARVKPTNVYNVRDQISERFYLDNEAKGIAKPGIGPVRQPEQLGPVIQTQTAEKGTAGTSINWALLCGSSNVYGMLVNNQRALQYNDNLNAVTFVHRNSATYTATGIPWNSGVILAEVSSNWGTSWDSTCIWAQTVHFGRYPQGAIYNPPGNTGIANSYIVGSGPVVDNGTSFSGSWFASKKLGTYDKTASTTTGAQQYFSFTLGTYPPTQLAFGWPRYGFSATDDGMVRSLGIKEDDQTGLSTVRGLALVKGTFAAGVFTWVVDSLIPNAEVDGTGGRNITSDVQMAWNEAGTIGYCLIPGETLGATKSNRCIQPIVFKTTNSGSTWVQVKNIDFNKGEPFSLITNNLSPVNTNSTLALPYMWDYNMVVDSNNLLHIGAVFVANARDHNDSLGYIWRYGGTNYNYFWPHVNGDRPYLVDFIGDGSTTYGWRALLIDSISSEDPGAGTTSGGYNLNPWDASNNAKINMDTRIQMSRTPKGEYITFSWAESDTNFTGTSGGLNYKWNLIPNIKTRCLKVGAGNDPSNYDVSKNKINITQQASGQGTQNTNVVKRATLHYMSPVSSTANLVGNTPINQSSYSYTAEVKVPFTVTNSNPYSQLTNNTTWYSSANLSFNFVRVLNSIKEYQLNSANESYIYPNPANNGANLSLNLKDISNIEVNITNMIGQTLKSAKVRGEVGDNIVALDLNGLKSGVYLVNVKVGEASGNQKTNRTIIFDFQIQNRHN